MAVKIIPGRKAFGDFFEHFIGLKTRNDDGTYSPTVLSKYGFDAKTVSGGYLKTLAGASISEATANDIASFTVPDGINKANYSWLKFTIPANPNAKVPAQSVVRRFRVRATSTANAAVVTTAFEIRVTEE